MLYSETERDGSLIDCGNDQLLHAEEAHFAVHRKVQAGDLETFYDLGAQFRKTRCTGLGQSGFPNCPAYFYQSKLLCCVPLLK